MKSLKRAPLFARPRDPYRRFIIALAAGTSIGAIAVAATVNVLTGRYLVDSTARITEDAVNRHFRFLIPTVFHADNPHAAHNAADAKGIELTVRLHFDIYRIVDTTFYRPDGSIPFAYAPGRTGTTATAAERDLVNRALLGETTVDASREQLRIWLPVRAADGATEGVVTVQRDLRDEWAGVRRIQAAVALAAALAAAGLFLALRRVYLDSTRELRARREDLERAYDASLRALSNALDSRDDDTAGHAERVTRYAARLRAALEWPHPSADDLRRGALLHDVGKIGVPDAILRKPGRLDAGELTVMRDHVRFGEAILGGVEFLAGALDVVRAHHERWDGTGYPNGLRGEQIPPAARIFSVCDTYDAMTSDRPYAAARSDAEARAEIAAQAGRQFDPRVVAAFLSIPADEWIAAGRGPDEPAGRQPAFNPRAKRPATTPASTAATP